MFSRYFTSRTPAPGPGTVCFAGATDLGLKRKNNEDAFGAIRVAPPCEVVTAGEWQSTIGNPDLLLAVSDGMGGAKGGEVASKLAIELLATELAGAHPVDSAEIVHAAANAANRVHAEIFRRAETSEDLRGMGATLCALWFRPGAEETILINVGDSRAYRWRDGRLEQISHDQTLGQAMLDRGELTPAQAGQARFRSILEHALGADGQPLKPQVIAVDHQPGDLWLLCSDGLHGALNDTDLARLLPKSVDARKLPALARNLVEAAKNASGSDNITVLLGLKN